MRYRCSTWIVALLFVLVFGCMQEPQPKTIPIIARDAQEIAKYHYRDFFDSYKYSVTREDHEWHVYVDFGGNMPGNHETLVIDLQGKIVNTIPGL